MRALIIADQSFAARERLMLSRLEVGLADEGVRVVRAQPSDSPPPPEGFSDRLLYEPQGALTSLLGFLPAGEWFARIDARSEARRLLERVAALALPGREGPIDIVHAWGEGCWPLAVELSRLCGAGLALEVWSAHLAQSLHVVEQHLKEGRESADLVWLAPTASIRGAVMRSRAEAPCRLASWGVHVSGEPSAWRKADAPASFVVISSGREPDSDIAAITGLAAAVRAEPNVLVFLDSAGVKSHHRVWAAAKSSGLLDRMSVIPDIEGRRELVLMADVLIQPEGGMGERSIVLDSMAAGMTVIARRDPYADALVEDRTAIIVDDRTAAGWEKAVHRVLADPPAAKRIGAAARDFLRRERTVSAHVAQIIAAYESIREREPLPFDAAPDVR